MNKPKVTPSEEPLKTSPQDILIEITRLSRLIAAQQRQADEEGFKDYGGAIGLQRLRNKRRALQAQLPALKVVGGTECKTSEHSSDASTTSRTSPGPSERSATDSPAPSPGAPKRRPAE